jgi:ATP-dependent helicase HrpA
MKEWSDIHIQLMQLTREAKLALQPRKDDYGAIHRSILTGFLSGIACRSERFDYTTAGGRGHGNFYIWPGSGVFGR